MENMPIEFINVVPVNPLISKCQIKVCYVGDEPNRNDSIITKDAARKLANSIPGCPIVGLYNEAKQDFEEHNKIIEIGNGKIKFSDATRPYGFVSMDAPVWFQWFEDDGVPHEYLMTEGYIWTGQYPESQRVIDKGNNQSMELDDEIIDAYWSKDNKGKPQFFIINEAIMSKLCILGEDVEPCFEGANITKVEFAFEDGFKQKLFSLIEQMQEMLKEGGTPVFNTYAVEIGDTLWSALYSYLRKQYPDAQDSYCSIYSIEGIYEEGSQKFAILRDHSNPAKYFRLNFVFTEDNFEVSEDLVEVTKTFTPAATPQFALEDVEAYIAEFKKKEEKKPEEEEEKKEDEPEDNKSEDEDKPDDSSSEDEEEDDEEKKKKEKKKEYTLEEIPEYVTLQNDYAAATARIAELEEQNNQLTIANAELVEFKKGIETEKKKELINSFYMLSDDDKKDCLDNIATYSYDEIEAKLSIICVRNKVSFDLGDDKKQEPTVFNLNDLDDDDQGLPAWVQRVQEVAKDNNI